MRRIPVVAALAAAALTGCSTGDGGIAASSSATPTYQLPPRTVRDGETAVRAAPARSGDLAFTVIGLSAGMPELVGSHADIRPQHGQFVRVRLITENRGRTTATFTAAKQLLVTTDGATFRPDHVTMLVKRQPESIDVGAAVRIELDLYYDIPTGRKPSALRVVGTPSVGSASDPSGIDIKLP
jgi:uncharacterized protein DUF4352/putative VirB-like lipoprotein